MELILLSIACWRLTYMLTKEVGPYDLVEKFRNWTLQSKISPLSCFYCTSVWVAAPLALFTDNFILYWLVISGVAIFLQAIHERLLDNV